MAAAPARSGLHLASVNHHAGDSEVCTGTAIERHERLVNLTIRVADVRRALLDAQIRRQNQKLKPMSIPLAPLSASIAVPASIPKKSVRRFQWMPEIVLTVIAFASLFLLPTDQLDEPTQFTLVMLIPFAAAIFVFGGAALWRVIRH